MWKCRGGIWLSYGWRSTKRRGDLETFSATRGRGAAGRLFEVAAPAALTFTSPRAWAFSVLGMQAYLDWFPGDRAIQSARNTLANRLLDVYERSRSESWHWFEQSL